MAPKKKYTKEQLNAALEAVARGTPVSTAAKNHSVPRITLLVKSRRKLPVDCRMGPSTILSTDEELLLEKWILSLVNAHHPVTKEQLFDSVELIIKESKRSTPLIRSISHISKLFSNVLVDIQATENEWFSLRNFEIDFKTNYHNK